MMSAERILIVDDEERLLQNVQAYLQQEGYETRTAKDGITGLQAARVFQPALIVLDIMLPGMDGLEVLRRVREESEVYVLMLTAKAEEPDKVIGLTLGADDYLTKPFSLRELAARIKAILRRGRSLEAVKPVLTFKNVRINPAARKAWQGDARLDLTPIEFDLLHALARHPGRVLSREQLIEQVWGHDYYGDERVVDVHIGRLRKKIERDASAPDLIVTARGAGYRFEDEPA